MHNAPKITKQEPTLKCNRKTAIKTQPKLQEHKNRTNKQLTLTTIKKQDHKRMQKKQRTKPKAMTPIQMRDNQRASVAFRE